MAVANRPASPFDPSLSPHPQPALTKRDVRRNRIMERLQGMIDSFESNQHQHYRAQLQAVQVDMTLVLRADPYQDGPLEDGGQDIRELVDGIIGGQGVGDEAAQRDFLALAGKRYGEFVREANDAMEQRDADLVALHNHYQSSVAELERLTQQKLHQAEQEHRALSETIRQRLIATINKKRLLLLRDKDSLDIADSNAMLLHPHHFSINNPGSPGGVGQNRKTRHLRHRAGSPSGADAGENVGRKKRKLLAVADDDSNESPAPGFRPIPPPDALGGGRSPFKDAREKNAYTQFEAPAYSLERIFTDKELALATATAQQATYRYFHQPQQQQPPATSQQDQHGQNSNSNGTTAPSVDGEAGADLAAATTQEGEEAAARPTTEGANGSPQPAAAPEMERTASHQVLTRGGARANPLAALSDLAAAAATLGQVPHNPGAVVRENPFAPVIPTYHAISRSEKSGAPAPGGVGALELENDFEMMRRVAEPDPEDPQEIQDSHMDIDGGDDARQPTAKEMRKQLLDQALENRVVSQPYRLPLLETGPAVVGKSVERPLGTGFATIAAFEAQRARQATSGAGAGLGGSLAQALQGRIAGGEPMSRTTSAGGSEGGEAVPAVGTGGGSGRRGRRLV